MRIIALLFGVIYTISGIAACITFLILKFYISAILGIATGIISFTITHLIILKRNGNLHEWYEARELRQLCWLGFWTFTVGCVSLVYFAVYMVLENEFEFISFTAIIWSFITAKSGLILMYYSNKLSEPEEPLTPREE